jgi:hypothetical protein
MDIQELLNSSDLNTLKAAAYDQIASNEQGERLLRAINERIAVVTNEQTATVPSKE